MIRLAASVESHPETHSSLEHLTSWTIGRADARALLVKDVSGLMMIPMDDIVAAIRNGDIPGMAEFISDFMHSYRKVSVYPFYKTGQLSTESWLLLAGANISLNPSPYVD